MTMTNLTDEGLMEFTKVLENIYECGREDVRRGEYSRRSFVEALEKTKVYAKQVRDAAKKEMREKAAMLVESSVITRTYGNGQTVVHECSKDPIQLATAIRQME